jgi:hypothetical protein
LYERFSLIATSLERVAQKKGLLSPLDKLYQLVTKGITATEQLWFDVQEGYAFVHRAAHILTNADYLASKEVQQQYEELLEEMRHSSSRTASLHEMAATFLKGTASYWPGLFHW